MREALNSEEHISILMNSFYAQAMQDEVIGPFFNKAMNFSLEDHLPVIISFWSSLLLDTHTYRGNPMLKHIALNKKMGITSIHFDRWLELWNQTIDQLYIGTNAELAKSKAFQIATLMKFKIEKSESPSSLI